MASRCVINGREVLLLILCLYNWISFKKKKHLLILNLKPFKFRRFKTSMVLWTQSSSFPINTYIIKINLTLFHFFLPDGQHLSLISNPEYLNSILILKRHFVSLFDTRLHSPHSAVDYDSLLFGFRDCSAGYFQLPVWGKRQKQKKRSCWQQRVRKMLNYSSKIKSFEIVFPDWRKWYEHSRLDWGSIVTNACGSFVTRKYCKLFDGEE